MRALVSLCTFLMLVGCGEVYRYAVSGPVGWQLKREIRDRGAKRIVLSELTAFAWDEVYLFGPYLPRSEVCKTLKLSVDDCNRKVTAESTDDGEMFVAFQERGALVHAEMHIRWHGDFTPVPEHQPIAKKNAVFKVVPAGQGALGGSWLKLVLE
jgi:hypothetical protein